jgi:hypothetical protein
MGIGLWSDPSPIPPWEFQMAPSEHAGEKTPFTIGQRGGARDRILSNVGPQRRLIGTEGSVMQRLRDRAGKESIQPGTPDIPRLEDVEKLGR